MKNILITGGSRGIGFECVKRFHKDGWNVITCSRNEKTWLENVKLFPELCNVDHLETDVSDDCSLNRLFEYIGSKYSCLHAAINNASPKIVSQGEFKEIPAGNLFSTLKSDFWSFVVCLQKELALMGSGSYIVNVSSVNGVRPCPGAAMYSAAKHGLEGLTRSVALEAIKMVSELMQSRLEPPGHLDGKSEKKVALIFVKKSRWKSLSSVSQPKQK